MQVWFRVDASSRIGSGHAMRCLTLADALRLRGANCTFVCRDEAGHLGTIIESRQFALHTLPPHPAGIQRDDHEALLDDWVGDAEETIASMAMERPDWLVVDHYGLDRNWEAALRPHVDRILVIDDLANRAHDADLLLDQNLVAGMDTRYAGLLPDGCGTMLGPDYALLQPDYAELHDRVPPREGKVRRLLAYFGGADGQGLSREILVSFAELEQPDLILDLVINPQGEHAAAIRALAANDARVVLHERLASLAPLMVAADLAIGAGGATTWERLCLGLPSLVVTLAPNQTPIASQLHDSGLVRWLGAAEAIDAVAIGHALRAVLATPMDPAWSLACAAAVDGRGSARVTSIICTNASTPLRARPARLADENLLLDWANDPETRRNAFSPDRIAPETHRAWFRGRLRRIEDVCLLIVESLDGLPVGQVRFERSEPGHWEIHYAVDPRLRGRKLGRPMMAEAIRAFARNRLGPAALVANVKADNVASARVFETLNFVGEAMHPGVLTFRTILP